MSIRFCKRCGEPIDMSPEHVAECEVICRAEFGKPMADPTPEQNRRMNSLRDFARRFACEIQSSTPAGPNQALAIRHVEDALMRANLAILADAHDTAEQSWTGYFDLEDSGSCVVQDGEVFREEPGGTYTPVGSVRKRSTN
jgi:hypothetical protein